MTAMSVIENGSIDPSTYVMDPNTGAKIIHYTAHYGNLKAMRALIEERNVDAFSSLDVYRLTPAHYAARSGNLAILVYLTDLA